jgi:hypothetical protein
MTYITDIKKIIQIFRVNQLGVDTVLVTLEKHPNPFQTSPNWPCKVWSEGGLSGIAAWLIGAATPLCS